jgi:hypothetical protein
MLLELSRLVQACTRTALPFTLCHMADDLTAKYYMSDPFGHYIKPINFRLSATS